MYDIVKGFDFYDPGTRLSNYYWLKAKNGLQVKIEKALWCNTQIRKAELAWELANSSNMTHMLLYANCRSPPYLLLF